jgi:excisionase family DNA binding protein
MEDLLTIPEVAKKLKVSEITIRRWLSKRTITAIKLPQGIRFREAWLDNWLDKRTIKAQKQTA